MIKILSLMVFVVSILSACATSVSVHSRPAGALISSNNQNLGISPVRISLDSEIGQSFQKSGEGCYEAPSFTAHWASGAVASSPESLLCRGRDGNYKIFIRRPANAPGLKKDLAAANTPEAVMARRREFMMENHLGGSNYVDNDNPDMPSNVVSLDDLENLGREWKERDSIQVGPSN
ncbi:MULTISPECIES: hypothetical protein [Polynucleobacter]|jgi:hypothetical protein|uniref:Uncharacterized protein n=1 Tax=Polynucleobacter yangtzensis TaxID=1743159 RepID=A0ABN6TTS4_9BURK|nr:MULTISPECIES: hypothetical protein [Polynucleobacter]QWD65525.1 hypothetical protein ICW03_07650 [Polynucleobacter sp. MWH-Aus1W21]BDT79423.1 hypothetical protein PKF032_13110 [Polynucleobacter yangtzensis]